MKMIKILLVLIFLFISISAVSAEGNFTALQNDIDSSTGSIDIKQDYAYDNTSDYKLNSGILINKSDITINGNGHTIDGSNQARIFNITANNIIISNIIFANGNINEGLGGALHSSGSVTLNNVTFKNSNANCGGAISVSGQSIINNAIFTNNTASEDGGAIIAWDKLTINNATFTNNAASGSGGAIYVIGQTTINNSEFINNQADFGGAIYTWTSTIIDSTRFKNNKGEYGGATYAAGKITINNALFSNNIATENGGAIDAKDETSITSTTFTGNIASENGGAIFTNGNSNQINSTFENNSADNGGAVYFNSEIENNIIQSIFNGNKATRAGAAIYVKGTASNNTFTSQFNNNIAEEASGGGIFFRQTTENNNIESIFTNNQAAYGAGMFFYSESNNNQIISDFTNNTALSCGGAIFFYSKTNGNKFKGNFVNNTALGLIDLENANGGAITFKNTSKNCEFDSNFTSNTARLNGGAVNYRTTAYNITFKGNFIANTAQSGGALNFFDEYENITFSCNFIKNNATKGGAIAINREINNESETYPQHNSTVANCNFINNHAEEGGAIFASQVICKNSNFNNNTALRGGAIYAIETSRINGTIFTNNIASENGGAIFNKDQATIDNSTFENNSAKEGGAIKVSLIEAHNCVFNSNHAENGGAIFFSFNSWITNSIFKNSHNLTYSLIYGDGEKSGIRIENCSFLNSTSKYAAAIFNKKNTVIINSNFTNLHSTKSGGAILLKEMMVAQIINCNFINTTAIKNGGAIFIDSLGSSGSPGSTIISNTTFINSSGNFGGALLQLGGTLTINSTKFINNNAAFDGGAIYTSNVLANIYNISVISNKLLNEGNNGGGIYFEKGDLDIKSSNFFNNTKNAIYAYDSNLVINQSEFKDNTESIHGVFLDCKINEINLNQDTLILNETDYLNCINKKAINLNPINNNITVTNLPKRFDSREWGWVSSIKNQIIDGSCWTFGTLAALESALLKSTGIEYDFSENNMKNNMLQYSKYGIMTVIESGYVIFATQGLLSWLEANFEENDTYDELGKVSPIFLTGECIHVQDAIFVGPRKNLTDNDEIKKAIIQCGSLAMEYYSATDAPDYNNKTHAQYQNSSNERSHAVSVVGWDDNYPKENFLTTPLGDGAWILKDNFGYENGDNGFIYLSYYDISFLNSSYAIGFIFENTDNYVRNYQRDLSGEITFLSDDKKKNLGYKTTYESQDNEAISGVGTYFKYGGEEYVLNIYVNNELKHTQNGTGPYYGFHTIKLTNEIPIKKGDNFTVEMYKNSIPTLDQSRQHYVKNTTFINLGNEWNDLTSENKTVSLKVYTKDLAIYTEDLVKIYKNASKFEANIGEANETVTFEINGGRYTRVSDENGTAKMAINLEPGNYTIKTIYNNASVENTITVLPTLIAENLVKYFRNASQFYISLIDGEGNSIAGKSITMNINGVFYNRLTNENGTAKLNINLEPGEYILTATDPLTGLMMSYNITVLPTLIADDLEMKYKDGSTFNVTVLNGQGKALANVKVTFNINGVFYNRISDSHGIAKLNINLMAGKYIITSEYENLRISNTITIKD